MGCDAGFVGVSCICCEYMTLCFVEVSIVGYRSVAEAGFWRVVPVLVVVVELVCGERVIISLFVVEIWIVIGIHLICMKVGERVLFDGDVVFGRGLRKGW